MDPILEKLLRKHARQLDRLAEILDAHNFGDMESTELHEMSDWLLSLIDEN